MRMLMPPIAVPVDAPSPLVGEGITASQHNDGWVRGSLAMPRQPLTRLRIEATLSHKGEGKKLAPDASQTT
jgi:hypothetical protein